ncbi:MAG: anti-sigma factor family protein, partial [Bryobacteraceae bacterium]
ALHQSRMSVREALGTPALRYTPPASLEKTILDAIASRGREQTKPERGWFRRSWRPWPVSIATAALTAALAIAIVWAPRPANPAASSLEREIVDDHIRSLMTNHLMDVVSTDQHTVKPWFDGKVDFSPPVADYSPEGFPLIGGRVDYVDRHPAAVLVYRRNKHIINVFVWPASGAVAERSRSEQGYNTIETSRDGMRLWIVSDLNREELTQFAALVAGS